MLAFLLSVSAFSPHRINSPKVQTVGAFAPNQQVTLSAPTRTKSSLFATTKKLSRPERKALEREKKNGQSDGQARANAKRKKAKKYELHSNNVSELCVTTSSADDVMKAIKR